VSADDKWYLTDGCPPPLTAAERVRRAQGAPLTREDLLASAVPSGTPDSALIAIPEELGGGTVRLRIEVWHPAIVGRIK